ncbi:MAG: EI24 domain-containing protein [Sphingomonadaceae bacterium]|nr:EI24 domain-containing protein [Sphingomonadaceae bacterium]
MYARAIRLSLRQLLDRETLRAMAKVIGLTIGSIALLGILLWQILLHLIVPTLQGWTGANWLGEDDAAGAALVLTLLGGWFLFRAIAMLFAGLFTDAIVASVEEDHYPAAFASAVPVPLRTEVALGLASLRRALVWNMVALPLYLLLLITGVGTILLAIALNAILLSRDLEAMVAARHPGLPPRPMPPARRRFTGLVASVAMVIPLFNLFAPIFGAAIAVHMLHMESE